MTMRMQGAFGISLSASVATWVRVPASHRCFRLLTPGLPHNIANTSLVMMPLPVFGWLVLLLWTGSFIVLYNILEASSSPDAFIASKICMTAWQIWMLQHWLALLICAVLPALVMSQWLSSDLLFHVGGRATDNIDDTSTFLWIFACWLGSAEASNMHARETIGLGQCAHWHFRCQEVCIGVWTRANVLSAAHSLELMAQTGKFMHRNSKWSCNCSQRLDNCLFVPLASSCKQLELLIWSHLPQRAFVHSAHAYVSFHESPEPRSCTIAQRRFRQRRLKAMLLGFRPNM